MISTEEALFWLPTAAVTAVALLAIIVALAQPPRLAKAVWIVITLLLGGAAVAATAWQQQQSRVELQGQTEKLRGVGTHLDEVGRQLPAGSEPKSAENFDSFP